jgi:hypothetical protein
VVGAVSAAAHLFVALRWVPPTEHDVLYNADVPRVHDAMRGASTGSARNLVHPLFKALTRPPTAVLQQLGASDRVAALAVVAAYGGLLTAAIFVLGRRRGLTRMAALAPAALVTVAGASVVHFAITETFGVTAGLAAVVLLVVDRWRRAPSARGAIAAIVVGAAGGLNGLALPVLALVRAERQRLRVARILATAALAGAAAVFAQWLVFGTRISLPDSGEQTLVTDDPVHTLLWSVRTAWLDAWALRAPRVTAAGGLTLDGAARPGIGLWWLAAVLLVVLWALVARAVWARRGEPLVGPVLGAIAAHVAFFSVYGNEPFLFSVGLVVLVGALVVEAAAGEPRVVRLTWAVVVVLAILNLRTVAQLPL